jgi:hypothetical protein
VRRSNFSRGRIKSSSDGRKTSGDAGIELILLQKNPARFQSQDFPGLDQLKIDLTPKRVDANDFHTDGVAEAKLVAVAAAFNLFGVNFPQLAA